jgi:6-phosphogluconolactonase
VELVQVMMLREYQSNQFVGLILEQLNTGSCFLHQVGVWSLIMNTDQTVEYTAYYGTSGSDETNGIYRQFLSNAPLSLDDPELISHHNKAGFLRLNRKGDLLYAIETGSEGEGQVNAFSRDSNTGDLSLLGSQAAGGGGLCHLNLDRSERWLLSTSYNDAFVTVFPLAVDGTVGELSQSFQLEGAGSQANPERQEAPHAHSVYTDPTNLYVFVCDLGMDRIYVYAFDVETGLLTPASTPYAEAVPGSGPRHLAFHGCERWVYAINELNGTVALYDWNSEVGQLTARQSVKTLPSDFMGSSTTAEILIHPNNRYLYASNRGHDSIVVYSVDESDGSLALVQRISSGGGHPRNFILDKSGQLLAVANRDSNNIVFFEVNQESGMLVQQKRVENVPECTCIRLLGPES